MYAVLRFAFATLVALIGTFTADAQGVLSDILAGKLIDPQVGQWAWYDLIDTQTNHRFVLRQAIVGQEEVGRKTGYWLELEVLPEVGFPTIYKMLLTGPASNPKNVHRLLLKQGPDPAVEVPVDLTASGDTKAKNPKEASRGKESVAYGGGEIQAEHLVLAADGRDIDLWINDQVRPMGIVRMIAPQGELVLREYGVGGEASQSKAELKTDPLGVTTKVEATVVDPPDKMRTQKGVRAGVSPPQPKEPR